MEMEQGDRDQRELDGEAGEDRPKQDAADPAPASLRRGARTRPDARMLVQGDDRDDRGEAHLEARRRAGFRPEQEHDQRADRDQPQGHRLAPERDAGRTSKAAMQERTVGTSAPVSKV